MRGRFLNYVVGSVLQPTQTAASLRNSDDVSRTVLVLLTICTSLNVIGVTLYHALRYLSVLPTPPLPPATPKLLQGPLANFLIGLGVALIVPVVGYFLWKFIWFRVFGYREKRQAVIAALGMSYAFAAVFLVPSYLWTVLMDYVEKPTVNDFTWKVYLLITLGMSTVYFSESLGISKLKSLGLNASALALGFVALMIATIIFGLVIAVVGRFS